MAKKARQILREAQAIIEGPLKKELADQGHINTGLLNRSINAVLTDKDLIGQAFAYIFDLQEYTPPNQVQVSDEELKKLAVWCVQRGIATNQTALGVAKAIVKKWKKFGKPSPGSYEFSKNGQRVGSMRNAYRQAFPKVQEKITKDINEAMVGKFKVIKSGKFF